MLYLKNKYYHVSSKRLADAILWVSGLKYFTYDDKRYEGQQIFSFEDTQEFRQVLTDLTNLKSKYNK